jgi:predicted dehydrogenase
MSGEIEARGPIQPIRIGIVGFGQIGRTHLDALAGHHDAAVVAVSRRHASANDPALDCYSDYRELVQRPDIDLVAICTPSGYHAEQALAVLQAGKGVVVEKPLALSVESGERVVRTASERGLFLSTISQRRTEDAVRVLKEALALGRLGRPVLGEALVRWFRDQRYYDSAPWRGTRAMDGGVLMNQAIHVIDLLCWLLGPVEGVSGVTSTLVRTMEAEDTASACLHFASGALGAITATTAIAPGLPAELNLFCERGLASLHDADVARWDVPDTPLPLLDDRPGSGSTDPAAIGILGHHRQWRDILDAFRHEREPLVTGMDGLATVATILAIEEASQIGRTVRPKYVHSGMRGASG